MPITVLPRGLVNNEEGGGFVGRKCGSRRHGVFAKNVMTMRSGEWLRLSKRTYSLDTDGKVQNSVSKREKRRGKKGREGCGTRLAEYAFRGEGGSGGW